MSTLATIILLCLVSSTQSWGGDQSTVVQKGHVKFTVNLLSPSQLSPRDTLRVRFAVHNGSPRAVVVLDCDVPGRQPYRRIWATATEEIAIDLGNQVVLDLGRMRKLRSVEPGETYSVEFALPMSEWWKQKRSRVDTAEIGRTLQYRNIPVVADVCFSYSDKFLSGPLKAVLRFDDYIGRDSGAGWRGVDAESLLQFFSISGITVTATK